MHIAQTLADVHYTVWNVYVTFWILANNIIQAKRLRYNGIFNVNQIVANLLLYISVAMKQFWKSISIDEVM